MSDALEYQTASTRFAIARSRVRLLVAMACVAAVSAYSVTFWPPVERKLHWRRVTEECRKYEMPATLVYRESPRVGRSGPSPAYIQRVLAPGGRRAEADQRTAQCVQDLRAAIPTTTDILFSGTVMLHELRTPSGERVIVHIGQALEKPMVGDRVMQGRRYPVPPAGMDLLMFDLRVDWAAICGPYKTFELFAGRPHESDRSSFVLDFECDGRTGQIVGTLQADDSVKLTAKYANDD